MDYQSVFSSRILLNFFFWRGGCLVVKVVNRLTGSIVSNYSCYYYFFPAFKWTSFEQYPFLCLVLVGLSSFLSLPPTCLHEGFENLVSMCSPECCANCTTASFGRDTHRWSPILCKSASRPRKPLDADSCCDSPLHRVMCHDGFPTMHSLVQCQRNRTNNLLPSQAKILLIWKNKLCF